MEVDKVLAGRKNILEPDQRDKSSVLGKQGAKPTSETGATYTICHPTCAK